jgi:acyl carrier protein
VNESSVVDIILGFLAEDEGCQVDQLRDELVIAGRELPIDSLLAVEVLVRVQDATGVKLPPTADTAFAMRSVHGFAQAVMREIGEYPARSVATA